METEILFYHIKEYFGDTQLPYTLDTLTKLIELLELEGIIYESEKISYLIHYFRSMPSAIKGMNGDESIIAHLRKFLESSELKYSPHTLAQMTELLKMDGILFDEDKLSELMGFLTFISLDQNI